MSAYRLTRAAAEDLVDIYIQGGILFGPAQADRYHAGLESAFRFLADYPRSARLRTEIVRPVRAYPYKSHLVVYDIEEDDRILILRVRHGHEDWMTDPD